MPADQVATRSVAFFLIKCAANFVAVAVVGVLLWLGVGPSLSPALTILPAALAVAVMVGVAALPLVLRRASGEGRAARAARGLGRGVSEALRLLATGNPAIVLGSLGYWAFDNLVLWACFHAFGVTPALTVVLMGYLIGQLGGLLPIPGGLGGVEGGLRGDARRLRRVASATRWPRCSPTASSSSGSRCCCRCPPSSASSAGSIVPSARTSALRRSRPDRWPLSARDPHQHRLDAVLDSGYT